MIEELRSYSGQNPVNLLNSSEKGNKNEKKMSNFLIGTGFGI